MEFLSLGGIKEHGRNCFLVKGDRISFMLDCGKGEKGETPDFSKTRADKIDYLFLSHSHLDHTGSVENLYQSGFSGKLLCSPETYHLLPTRPKDIIYLNPNHPIEVDGRIKVLPRRSGHCFGALSFEIRMEGKTILYTGDYLEDTVFEVDPIRNRRADLAIVDACYSQEKSYEENKEAFLSLLEKQKGKTILPLPKNGRSMDVIDMLNENGIPYSVKDNPFFQEETEIYLKKEIPVMETENADVLLIQDPQLSTKRSREFVDRQKKSNLIFTGTIDEGSYSDRLMKQREHTYFSRINVHQSLDEAKKLVLKNEFKKTVFFHNKELSQETHLLF